MIARDRSSVPRTQNHGEDKKKVDSANRRSDSLQGPPFLGSSAMSLPKPTGEPTSSGLFRLHSGDERNRRAREPIGVHGVEVSQIATFTTRSRPPALALSTSRCDGLTL